MNPTFEATLAFGEVPSGPASAVGWRLPAWVKALLPLRTVMAAACSPDHLDQATGLFNRTGLFSAAAQWMDADEDGRGAAVIVLDFSDLREVHEIYGGCVSRRIVAHIVRKLRGVAGPHGLVGRTDRAQFTLVLPGAGEDVARRRLQRQLGKPARIEFDAGDSEIVLVPDLAILEGEAGPHGIQPLHRQMCRDISRRRQDELRRQHWLTRERERHSRPMGLAPSA